MDSSLPNSLRERTRWIRDPRSTANDPGEFVLYWMHNALRAHENPALDVAICLARQNGLPLLVYQGLSEDYPYASDRIHAFLLQGHRDVQRELAERGIVSIFHLQRKGNRGPFLRDLTRAAALLVTEEMPVQPLVGWVERLTQTSDTPIAAVDSTCLAPVTSLPKPFARSQDRSASARDFRSHAAPLHHASLNSSYREQVVDCAMSDPRNIEARFGIESVSLDRVNLAELLHECKIDHSIAPVTDTPGGSRAGYRRWEYFRENGLKHYRHARANPIAAGGASRMSAYLHYGMVSPFRIAREAATVGAEKFLDELLVWRELSFHFCFHHIDNLESLDAVPSWARETLMQHASDQREENCSWERLARAGSQQEFWNAAQRSLLKHGELHNNVRMTWGKSLLPWLSSPLRALQVTFDLNHRYSLDGRNPASYGGILWCFGQFDRPGNRELPIYGKLKSRNISEHSKRVDLTRFMECVDRPIADRLPKIAVIGGGISGLIAARTLQDHGLSVTVFDKARGVGGRTSTRRTELADGTNVFVDHGTQYFTARDPRFCRYVQSWMHDGVVSPWIGRMVNLDASGNVLSEKNGAPRYVGTPGMNAIAQHLALELNVQTSTRVTELVENAGSGWRLKSDETALGDFDVVLASCPAPQTAELFSGRTPLADVAKSVHMQACWTMMLADETLKDPPFEGALIQGSPIGWIAMNHRKPGRETMPTWVIQATADWTHQHVDESADEVQKQLRSALSELVKTPAGRLRYQTAHRWLYAQASHSLDREAMFDAASGLGVFGDWCSGTKLEAAFLSGMAMAGAVMRHYTIDRRPYHPRQRREQPTLF